MTKENKEDKNKKNTNTPNIKDNLKKDDLILDGRTEEALDKFINAENDYSNVGIIGDLGIGKSSVICSYLKDKDDIQAIYLSIPRFNKKNKEEKDNQESKDIQESKEIRKIIVYLLLEAIKDEKSKISFFSRVTYSMMLEKIEDKINSNYSLVQGKKYINWFSIISTILIMILLVSIFKVDFHLKDHNTYVLLSFKVLYVLSIIIVVGIIINKIIMFILGLNVENFSIGKLKVQQKEENTFLDEDTNFILSLLHLYSKMSKKKIILIIEDLDRFENKVIFEELYQISNIKKDITFVYLIKNSQFDSEHISKYFDAIVDLQSTKDVLYLEDLMMNELSGEIYSNLIVTIVPYIGDIRQYNRIYNRYYLMKENYEKAHEISEQIQNEIFALAFLKELFYDQIQNESNETTDFKKCVDNLFDESKQKEAYLKSKKDKIDEIKEEINKVEESIKKYDEMYLKSENLEEEALEKLLKGYLYENSNIIIEGTNYSGFGFLNNSILLQQNYDLLLECFGIEKFSSSKKIIERKEVLEVELGALKEKLEHIENYEFDKLSNTNKVKLVVDNTEDKGEFLEVNLIANLINKGYLNQHWDIYLTPNNLENEIEINKRRIRYNFRKSNNEIEDGNVIYNDDFDKNRLFIDLFHYSDFEKSKELINESLLLFLWNNNSVVGFDNKLQSINICIRNNISDEKVIDICKDVLVNIIGSVEKFNYEKKFISKYKFMKYLTPEFVEVLIAIAKNNETLNKNIIEIFISCRVKEQIFDAATKYALINIGDVVIDEKVIKRLLSKVIVMDNNIINNLEDFVNKVKEIYKFNLLKEYKEEMVKTKFYVSNTNNIIYLMKNNVVTHKLIKEIKDSTKFDEYKQEISNYLDNNYKELVGEEIELLSLFRKYIITIEQIDKYTENQELLNFIINDRKYSLNTNNIKYLIKNSYIEEIDSDIIEYLYENDAGLFNDYIIINSDKVVEFIKQYESEKYKVDITNRIIKEELLEIDILKQLIDEVPMFLSIDYTDNINDYIFEEIECEYDEIKDYLDKSRRKYKKYYLQLMEKNFKKFLKDYNLQHFFSFTSKGQGKNVKNLEKNIFIVEDNDMMNDILAQAKEEKLISDYEVRTKVKIRK